MQTLKISRLAHHRHSRGVSLIELIIVIAITGILASTVAILILRPIQGYDTQTRRSDLVDRAENALRRMQRDIRTGLPNSIRIPGGTGQVIEMLNTINGARYRDEPGLNGPNDHSGTQFQLTFTGPDTDGFNIVGTFPGLAVPFNSAGTNLRLAIYNQGIPNADAYADAVVGAGARVITNPATATFTVNNDAHGDEHQITPNGGANFQFRWPSPAQRIFVVDRPISYICNLANGTLTRYDNYPIAAAQPVNPAIAPLNNVNTNVGLVADNVTACTFTYQAGSSQRSGLVTLAITVSDPDSGEQVRLLHQVHVDNAS